MIVIITLIDTSLLDISDGGLLDNVPYKKPLDGLILGITSSREIEH